MVISKSDGLYGRFVRAQTRIDFSIKVKKNSFLPKIYIGLWYSITATLQNLMNPYIQEHHMWMCMLTGFFDPENLWNYTPLVHKGLTIYNLYIHLELLFRFL